MTTIAEPPVLDVQGVSKRFAGVLALADVSVELRAGQVHALVGENGAGKSTLIKVLTGVHQPDEGTIVYRGEPVTFARPLDAQAAGISTIYQEVNLVPLMSVARNLFLGREPTHAPRADRLRADASRSQCEPCAATASRSTCGVRSGSSGLACSRWSPSPARSTPITGSSSWTSPPPRSSPARSSA